MLGHTHTAKKTLVLDSAYRDRCLYPNPADFVVPYQNLANALQPYRNPVSQAYPIFTWQWNWPTAEFTGPTQIIVAGSPSAPVVAETPEFVALTELATSQNTSATTIQQAEDMFRSIVLKVDTTTYSIIGYDALTRTFSLDKDIVNFATGTPYSLINLSTNTSLVLQGYNFTYIEEGSNDSGNSVTSTSPLWVWDLSQTQILDAQLVADLLEVRAGFDPWKISDVHMLFSQQSPLAVGAVSSLGFLVTGGTSLLSALVQTGSTITTQTLQIPLGSWTSTTLASYLNSNLGYATVAFDLRTAVFTLTATGSTTQFQIESTSTCLNFLGRPPTDSWATQLASTTPVPWNQVGKYYGYGSIYDWTFLKRPSQPWAPETVLVAVDAQGIGEATFLATDDGFSAILTSPGTEYVPQRTYFLVPLVAAGTPLTVDQQMELGSIQVRETAPVVCLDGDVQNTEAWASQFLLVAVWTPLFTTTRYETDTGNTTAGLFTSFVGSFPPPPPPVGATSLASCYAHYGVQVIRKSFPGFIGGDIGSPLKVFVHLETLDLTLATRMTLVAENLWRGDAYSAVALSAAALPVTADSFNPLNYSGSTVSQAQMNCYSLEISSLVLPNQPMNEPFGGLTSSFPYVCLEVSNETAASAHNRNVIYSNNPFTTFATFILPISDVNNPTTTKFIKLFSAHHQHVKFRPNDSLRFRVSFPNGSTFQTTLADNLPPLYPNPLLQISMLMELKPV